MYFTPPTPRGTHIKTKLAELKQTVVMRRKDGSIRPRKWSPAVPERKSWMRFAS
jgi:hypothetical protein